MGELTSNPYSAVDWSGQQVASTTHSHVFEPTATGISAADHLQAMIDAGYRHFAISNYNPSDPASSYPLTNLPGVASVAADVIGCPNAEHYGFHDAPGHLGAPGCLLATGTAAPSGYVGPWKSWVDLVAANMQHSDGGGITINHPAISAYVGDAVAKAMIDYSPLVLGIEIYDGFTDWSPDYTIDGLSLDTWHRLLVTGRRCWGFAVPDHWKESVGHPAVPKGVNRLLVPASYAAANRATREHLCLKAYRNGQFYAALSLPDSPVLTNVAVSATQIQVTFAASCDISFHWAKFGDTTARATAPVTGTTATYTLTGEEIYVRAEAKTSADARSFTQPIMFKPPVQAVDMRQAMMVLG